MRAATFGLGLTLLLLASGVTRSYAADIQSSPAAPNLTAVRANIKAKNYTAALAELRDLSQTFQHADVYNLMGFSYRKSGDLAQAATFYAKALELDPGHKGALEYQGQLFAGIGQLDKARANAAKLKRLCPKGCEELHDLEEAIAKALKAR